MLASLFIANFWLVFRNESKYCLIWWHLVGISRLFQSLFLLLLLLCSSTIIFYIRVTNPYKKVAECLSMCLYRRISSTAELIWNRIPPPPPPHTPSKIIPFLIKTSRKKLRVKKGNTSVNYSPSFKYITLQYSAADFSFS